MRRGECKRRGGRGIWEANLDLSSSINVRVEVQEEIPIKEVFLCRRSGSRL